MGTWLLLALPFVVGYMLTRADREARRNRPAFDATMLWLGGAAAAMLAGALASLSRSTAVGLAAAALVGTAVGVRRGGRPARWLFAAAIMSVLVALSLRQTSELAARFENSRATAEWDRPEIWRETAAIVRDFPAAGVGAGAFEGAMLVYQRADRQIFFNQAHDQYLQFAAEGGLLLLVPLAWLAIAIGRSAALRLTRDRSPSFWIRAGALAAVVGVLVQNVWETGLRMPANALLFAAVVGVLLAPDGRQR
jgi:O-antigen ligase